MGEGFGGLPENLPLLLHAIQKLGSVVFQSTHPGSWNHNWVPPLYHRKHHQNNKSHTGKQVNKEINTTQDIYSVTSAWSCQMRRPPKKLMDLHQFMLPSNFSGSSPNTSRSIPIRHSHQTTSTDVTLVGSFVWRSVSWLNLSLFQETLRHSTHQLAQWQQCQTGLPEPCTYHSSVCLSLKAGGSFPGVNELRLLSLSSSRLRLSKNTTGKKKDFKLTFAMLRTDPIILFEDSEKWSTAKRQGSTRHILIAQIQARWSYLKGISLWKIISIIFVFPLTTFKTWCCLQSVWLQKHKEIWPQ